MQKDKLTVKVGSEFMRRHVGETLEFPFEDIGYIYTKWEKTADGFTTELYAHIPENGMDFKILDEVDFTTLRAALPGFDVYTVANEDPEEAPPGALLYLVNPAQVHDSGPGEFGWYDIYIKGSRDRGRGRANSTGSIITVVERPRPWRAPTIVATADPH